LKILQTAMRRGGFYGLRTEWWHFIAYNWKKFGPVREIKLSSQ
jgi:D-alanyl-D-alanine dipeptidase